MSLLFVTANPKQVQESYSLQLGDYFLAEYLKHRPAEKVEKLDLFDADLPPLKREELALWERHGEGSGEEESVSNPYVEQFLKADIIVIVTPLWNMSFPSQVKAYVDHLIIPGKTFRFTEAGIEGLMQHKKMVHVQSRGGVYSEGPLKFLEHGDSYLRTIFGLTGIKDYYHLFIEGTSTFPEEVNDRLMKSKKQASQLAETLALSGERGRE
ncbi:FMN-dependent NADH-azoreductase [Salipaludibacillus aurantiacus]|uniref:FMN dependent NADH:quinone oxidoreductase n=1 Tax=Salipaludibacillus aurantiacus TaxID=1601833 RepID=A0A1H9X2C0_9BACI|nr:NAD(P)H-dependent oxidoreductase [Salipaludibacillus aurantiacus]SES40255.1 FMN-dependent NADH-azoreductase [Salipaludibacillus aurantiacus]